MPIQYDARSLVPDLTDSLRMAMGIAEQRREKRGQEEALGIAEQLPTTGVEALLSPENKAPLMRLAKLNPEMAQFVISLAGTQDEAAHRKAAEELDLVSNTFQGFLDIDDPAERNTWLAGKIREFEADGKDASKLRELIGVPHNKQTLRARANVIAAGDGKMLVDSSIKTLTETVQLQNAMLDKLQKERELAHGKDSDVAGLRKEFTSLSGDFIKVRDAHSRLKASADRNSAAGDLALVFNFMKILDPGSTVREGEQASAQNAAGVPDQIKNLYNRALTGERLSPAQRADFIATSDSVFTQQRASHEQLREQYRRLAEQRNFAPADVVVDFLPAPAPEKPEKPGAAAGTEQEIGGYKVRVKN